MKNTTLCYIEKDEKYLMLHRIKKQNDINRDKWIGIGGKVEDGESPHDCIIREIKEETGISPTNIRYRGLITFVSNIYETEYMHLFSCNEFEGEIISSCDEGNLEWIAINDLLDLPMWEVDKIFLSLLKKENRFFSLKLVYTEDTLTSYSLHINE